jgi:hypothetical protein
MERAWLDGGVPGGVRPPVAGSGPKGAGRPGLRSPRTADGTWVAYMPCRCRVLVRRASCRLASLLLLTVLAVPGRTAEPSAPAWPFVPVRRPAVPTVRHGDWVSNPIDAFVLARLEQAGLLPNPPADRLTLLRRVTFDLTGLLPTPAEREAFLADHSPDAYEKLVDRLLASPHFGERWAQHWLDVVRYAETDGYNRDGLRPTAYRYRDYVIQAFNRDLPYDRFISQQLAGDELEPDDPDALIATGFLRLPTEDASASDYPLVRQDCLDNVTDVVGTTFLGLTLGCARCHDHKFDPLTQKDYYRLQAFFAALLPCDLPLVPAAEQERHRRQQAAWEEATRGLRARQDALVAAPRQAIYLELVATFDPQSQQALATPAERRTALQRQLVNLSARELNRRVGRAHRRLGKEQRAAYDALQKEIDSFAALKPAPLPTARGVANTPGEPPATYRLAGGNFRKPRERLQPGFPECLGEPSVRASGAGRRSALARWLCRPEHPLTGRVLVNRLWQYHLGMGLAGTPNDFGAMGEKPTHPELLDYLAAELVQGGWKLKPLHRLIVTSATYRQASSPGRNPARAAAEKADPDGRLLWHARVKRREAEAIRDAALQVAGRLDLRLYGPSVCPELPAPVADSVYAWYADPRQEDRNRRSVYVLAKRNFAYPLFAAFDQPDRVNSCPVRAVTITAPQALAMLNGEFTLAQARHLADSLRAEHGGDTRRVVRAAYLRVFGRDPDRDEAAAAEKFLTGQARLAGGAPGAGAALVDFCHALLNSEEFLDVE